MQAKIPQDDDFAHAHLVLHVQFDFLHFNQDFHQLRASGPHRQMQRSVPRLRTSAQTHQLEIPSRSKRRRTVLLAFIPVSRLARHMVVATRVVGRLQASRSGVSADCAARARGACIDVSKAQAHLVHDIERGVGQTNKGLDDQCQVRANREVKSSVTSLPGRAQGVAQRSQLAPFSPHRLH